jgi:hypothetical protein
VIQKRQHQIVIHSCRDDRPVDAERRAFRRRVVNLHHVTLFQRRERLTQVLDRGEIERRNQLTLPVNRQLPAKVFLLRDLDAKRFGDIRRGEALEVSGRTRGVQRNVVQVEKTEQMHARGLCRSRQRRTNVHADGCGILRRLGRRRRCHGRENGRHQSSLQGFVHRYFLWDRASSSYEDVQCRNPVSPPT